MAKTSCENCNNYIYNEAFDCWQCEVDMDEDEMYRLLNSFDHACPYYRDEDEYFLARKQ